MREELDLSTSRRVVFAVGAAGTGKSQTVGSFLADTARSAFVRLRPERCDLTAFGRDLVDAAAPYAPALPAAYATVARIALRTSDPAARLGTWFGRNLGAVAVVAIDDLHLAGSDVRDFIVAAIASSPAGATWLLVDRDTHRWPLATWLAEGTAALPISLAATAAEYDRVSSEPRAEPADEASILAFLDARGFDLIEANRDDEVDRLVARLSAAGRLRSAVALLVEAGRQSALGRHDIAESWYQHAAAVAADDVTRARVELEYACDLMRRGRRDCVPLLERVCAVPVNEAFDARALASLAGGYAQADDLPRAAESIERALSIVRAWDAGRSVAISARVYRQAAYVALRDGRDEKATAYAERAIEVARRHGLGDIVATALTVLIAIASTREDSSAETLDLLRRLETCARDLDDAYLLRYAIFGQLDLFGDRGDWHEVTRLEAILTGMEVENDARHADETLVRVRAMRAAAAADFPAALSVLDSANEPELASELLAFRRAERALYGAAAGDAADAARCIADVDSLASRLPPSALTVRAEVITVAAEWQLGLRARARGRLERVVRSARAYPRMEAFARAVDAALSLDSTGCPDGGRFIRAIVDLRACGLGGLAAVLAALPMPVDRSVAV